MKFGLSDSEYTFLFNKLINPIKKMGAKVFIFGSRAKGTEKKFSDVDLLVEELIPINSTNINILLLEIEESNFPYKIDLVNNRSVAKSYKEYIEKEKIEL